MLKTGLYLVSDFIDYYDREFHNVMATKTFRRLSKSGMNRREMLKFLDKVGLNTPPHGTIKYLYDNYYTYPQIRKREYFLRGKETKVVVYLDGNSHRGENKILLNFFKALQKYPNYYGSIYITNDNSISYRHLQIGKKSFLLEYSSNDNWRSNYGDVKITLLKANKDKYFNKINYSLFALDYVLDKNGNKYYIDFNIAPGCPEIVICNDKEIEFKKILSAKDAADNILRAEKYFKEDVQ